MNKEDFLDCYLNYEAKNITINYNDETDDYSISLQNNIKKTISLSNELYQNLDSSKKMALQVIKDFITSSSKIERQYKGTYKTRDIHLFNFINEEGRTLSLIAKDPNKAFPLIFEDKKKNKTLEKLKRMIDENQIKNIVVKSGDSNHIDFKKDNYLEFKELANVLVIEAKSENSKTIASIEKLLLYFIQTKEDQLLNIFYSIDKNTNSSNYVLTFADGMIFIKDNELISNLVEVKKKSKNIVNSRRKEL